MIHVCYEDCSHITIQRGQVIASINLCHQSLGSARIILEKEVHVVRPLWDCKKLQDTWLHQFSHNWHLQTASGSWGISYKLVGKAERCVCFKQIWRSRSISRRILTLLLLETLNSHWWQGPDWPEPLLPLHCPYLVDISPAYLSMPCWFVLHLLKRTSRSQHWNIW